MGEDKLLPTPNAALGSGGQTSRSGDRKDEALLGNIVGLTSASSPELEDSTSQPKLLDTDASDRSSGTPTAPESSNDTGPTFPAGATSPSSPLLPSPTAQAAKHARLTPFEKARAGIDDRHNLWETVGNLAGSPLLPTPRHEGFDAGNHRGQPDGLPQTVKHLLPTPTATPYGNNQSPSPGAAVRPSLDSLISSSVDSPASQRPPQAAAKAPTTTAGSGPSSPVSLASWDHELSSWRTSQVSLLSTEDERFPRFSERWPTSGMTRRGEAFALPMSVRPTAASGSSSSPMLRTVHGMSGGTNGADYDGHGSELSQQIYNMLPTPVADHSRGLAQPGTDYQSLPNAVLFLGGPTNPPSEGGKL